MSIIDHPELAKYKSKLFREDKSLVFISEDFERRWDKFTYLPSAHSACDLLYDTYRVQEYGDYVEENLGKNHSILGSFMNQDNFYIHEESLRIDYTKSYKRLKYKAFINKYGITPLNFKIIFNSIMREIWEIKPYFSRYCFVRAYNKFKKSFKIDDTNVNLLHKNINLILEAKENNLDNIVPYVFYSGLSYKELEKVFGKNLWCELKTNSHSRNNLIANKVKIQLKKFNEDNYKLTKLIPTPYDTEAFTNISDEVKFHNKFSSTVLAKVFHLDHSQATLALNNCCTPKEFIEEYKSMWNNTSTLYSIIKETIELCKDNYVKYDLNWTKEDWIKKNKELGPPF